MVDTPIGLNDKNNDTNTEQFAELNYGAMCHYYSQMHFIFNKASHEHTIYEIL